MKRKTSTACLLAAGIVLSMAETRASGVAYTARIDDVAFGVIDLTPNDGAAASYTYALQRHFYEVALSVGPDFAQRVIDDTLGDTPTAYTLAYGASRAAYSATGMPGILMASGKALQEMGPDSGTWSTMTQDYRFALAPYSVLTVSAHGLLDLAYDGPPTDQDGEGVVSIALSSPQNKLRGGTRLAAFHPGVRKEEDIFLTYANPTGEAIDVLVSFSARGSSYVASPIPEPSTYAMLALGLLTVGAAVRRRA